MYELSVTTYFDAAHRLRDYPGKCAKLHGHTWKIDLTVKGTQLDATGMLVDFSELKKIVKKCTETFDHSNLNDLEAFSDNRPGSLNPTAENLARYIFEEVSELLAGRYQNVAVKNVAVWESRDSKALFCKESI